LTPDVQSIIAVVGAVTALVAATIGLVQNDIKKVLAYSTVSQLGLMFLALGLGAYEVAVFHVITRFLQSLFVLGFRFCNSCFARRTRHAKYGWFEKAMPITLQRCLLL
jgi:NADH-quinone oxidoreductase subunit L